MLYKNETKTQITSTGTWTISYNGEHESKRRVLSRDWFRERATKIFEGDGNLGYITP